MEEEEEDVLINDVMERLDNLELQVGVIDSNMGELNFEVRRMGCTSRQMNRTLNMINHNLSTYFSSQNFVPPPFPHNEEMEEQDSSEEEGEE